MVTYLRISGAGTTLVLSSRPGQKMVYFRLLVVRSSDRMRAEVTLVGVVGMVGMGEVAWVLPRLVWRVGSRVLVVTMVRSSFGLMVVRAARVGCTVGNISILAEGRGSSDLALGTGKSGCYCDEWPRQ